MEPKTFEWLETELNNASDDRDEINNKLNAIMKHLKIEEDNVDDDLNLDDSESDFDL